MEAFVYCWTDHKTEKLYIGSHKGTIDDGYVCSSKLMMEQYLLRPQDFTRQVIAEGTWNDMRILEAGMLDNIDVMRDPNYYNQTNGNEKYCNKGHTTETSRKISESLKGRILSEKHKHKISNAAKKRTHSEETRLKMSKSQQGKPKSDTHKQKISESHKGKFRSEESKRKQSETRKAIQTRRGQTT